MRGQINPVSLDKYADLIKALKPYLNDVSSLQAVLPLIERITQLENENQRIQELEKRYIEKCQEVIRLNDEIRVFKKKPL